MLRRQHATPDGNPRVCILAEIHLQDTWRAPLVGYEPTYIEVSGMLTRAPLGYSAERAPLGGGGGAYFAPLPNSRTNRRSEAGEAAIESPEREDSSAH